jgi:hypothetical protein
MSEKKKPQPILALDPTIQNEVDDIIKAEVSAENDRKLVKFLVETVEDNKYARSQFVSKGYEYDPNNPKAYEGLYRRRDQLLPYYVCKQLAENDDLLAIILQVRGNQLSQFGHVQTDRHKIGYKISYRNNKVMELSPEKRKELNERVNKVRDLIYNCGHTHGLKNFQQKTFPQFLKEVARAALLVGFAPIEIIRTAGGDFHHFKVLDFGTIYRAPLINKNDPASEKHLKDAFEALKAVVPSKMNSAPINWQRLDYQKFAEGFYSWVQVTNSIPVMAFTDEELICHYYYINNEMQWNSYPFSPLEGVVKDITSHIHANAHNANYFKNGRAARGFLTIMSDDVTEMELQRIRTQFYASINSSANSWRMPLFGVGKEDEVKFQAFDQANRDQEFVYLSDNLSRVILSAFGMDPSELPGFGHLARGTFSQALSESSNEYSLQVARSSGFKPLLYDTQILMNKILSMIDPLVAEFCVLEFVGLDIDDPQKESVRLQQDMNVFLNYNDIMKTVEKNPVPIGGSYPLNPQFLNAIREHYSEGVMQYAFSGNKDALYDPWLAFYNNGFFFQWISLFPELMKSKDRVQDTLKYFTMQVIAAAKKKDGDE